MPRRTGWAVILGCTLLPALLGSRVGNPGVALGADAWVPALLKNPVDIELRSGQRFKGASVVNVVAGPTANTFRSIEFKDPNREKFYILRDRAIKLVEINRDRRLVYCEKPNLLVLDNEALIKQVEKQADVAKAKAEAKAKAQKAKLAAQAAKLPVPVPKPEAPAVSRKPPWPVLSEAQQHAALEEEEARLADTIKAYGLTVTETNFFLFCTDLPVQTTREFSVHMDAMYDELCTAFEQEHSRNIWLGKAVIVMFRQRGAFINFELEYMRNASVGPDTIALCHGFGDGRVIIAGTTGNSPIRFAQTLVHETVHGFVHRYKSSVHIPSWLNEGAAEWVAGAVVKNPNTKDPNNPPVRAVNARKEVANRGSLGGDFFTDRNIDTWQYGVACDMTTFLLHWPDNYRTLIDGIKGGLTWQESLHAAYGVTPEELVDRYGQWSLGKPGLRP